MTMNLSKASDSVREAVRDEAIDWFLRFCEDEVGSSDCLQFDAWLKRSPENVRAYLQISAFWEAAGSMNNTRRLEIDELVKRATAEGNVVPLDAPTVLAPARARQRPRPSLAMAASVLLIVLAGAWSWRYVTGRPEYITQVGEERTLTLPDQSIVHLNARSRIRVRFTESERTLDLLEGEALFKVAKNPNRPFLVISGTTTVRAVGTQFDVNRKTTDTVVTVVEGHVSVSQSGISANASGTAEPVILAAGDQVTVSPHRPAVAKQTNPTVATAWTQGKLIFDNTPIADVVHEFNRYNSRTLTIEDPTLLSLHVSGTFATADSEQIVRFLSVRFGLVAHESADGIRLSRE